VASASQPAAPRTARKEERDEGGTREAELGFRAGFVRDFSPGRAKPAGGFSPRSRIPGIFIGFTVVAARSTLTPPMGNLKKKRRLKMNKHKRRKRLKSHRHKKRTWQK
jgi:hypothetical protein